MQEEEESQAETKLTGEMRLVIKEILKLHQEKGVTFKEIALLSIWAFFSAYLLVFMVCLLGVISCGVETFDAFNAVIACLNNLGPGLGSVNSNFVSIPDSAKWILTLTMVCGRLEIFSLLVLFTPAFWKS